MGYQVKVDGKFTHTQCVCMIASVVGKTERKKTNEKKNTKYVDEKKGATCVKFWTVQGTTTTTTGCVVKPSKLYLCSLKAKQR